jgi:hypothetical protein
MAVFGSSFCRFIFLLLQIDDPFSSDFHFCFRHVFSSTNFKISTFGGGLWAWAWALGGLRFRPPLSGEAAKELVFVGFSLVGDIFLPAFPER